MTAEFSLSLSLSLSLSHSCGSFLQFSGTPPLRSSSIPFGISVQRSKGHLTPRGGGRKERKKQEDGSSSLGMKWKRRERENIKGGVAPFWELDFLGKEGIPQFTLTRVYDLLRRTKVTLRERVFSFSLWYGAREEFEKPCYGC